MRCSPFLLVMYIALFMGVFVSCSNSSNPSSGDEDVEIEIDPKLSALIFEGGVAVTRPIPSTLSCDSPLRIKVIRHSELRIGAPFAFTLESEQDTLEEVTSVLVALNDADGYIEVPGRLYNHVFELAGELEALDSIQGESISLQFALRTQTGVIGPLAPLAIAISDKEETQFHSATYYDGIRSLYLRNSQAVYSPPPEGALDDGLPQIESLSGISKFPPEGPFSITIKAEHCEENLSVVVKSPFSDFYLSVPFTSCSTSSVHLCGFISGYFREKRNVSPPTIFLGDTMVYQFALQNKQGVGLYRNWAIQLVSPKEAKLSRQEYYTNTWVTIPAGSFMMGCSSGDKDCVGNESPQHRVDIPSFKLMKYEVTQFQYEFTMRSNPSHFSPYGDGQDCGPECPVESVSYYDAQDFCENIGARLPSESEWEYAARAGSTTPFSCGDDPSCLDATAWYRDNSKGHPHPVGQKEANAFGLHDMTGNVFEIVQDDFCSYTYAPTDGSPHEDCHSDHAMRGGSWYTQHVRYLRTSHREAIPGGYSIIGFRCAMDL